MSKALQLLALSICLVAGLAASNNDYAATYAGNYIGSGGDYTDYYQGFTCPKALSSVNQAISELTDVVRDTESTQWDVFGKVEKLQGLSYFIDNGCNTTSLEVSNKNKSNQTDAQAKACDDLIAIVQSLIDQNGSGSVSSSDSQGSIQVSQQSLGLAGNLTDACQVQVAEKVPEEEEQQEEETSVEATEPATPVEESVESEAAAEEVSSEEYVAEEDNNELEDLLIEVTKEVGGKTDTYVIYYEPDHQGHADLLVLHTESDENASEEEASVQGPISQAEERRERAHNLRHKAAEEREEKHNLRHKAADLPKRRHSKNRPPQFYTVVSNGDTDSGSQWVNGGYQRYIEPTQWMNGAYQRFYDNNSNDVGNDDDNSVDQVSVTIGN